MPSLRAEAASKVTGVRLSPQELERLREAAKANHQKTSAFIRDAILTATEDCLDPWPEDEKDGICSP